MAAASEALSHASTSTFTAASRLQGVIQATNVTPPPHTPAAALTFV
jgi:hypothetical protein